MMSTLRQPTVLLDPGPPAPEPSWQSRVFNCVLRLLPQKKRLGSAATLQERVHRLALRPASYEPPDLGRDIKVTLQQMAGWPVYQTAASARHDDSATVVFLHGGGYFQEIARAHWRFVGYLTCHAAARCVVPIFPLLPHATANDLVPAMGERLRRLLEEVGPSNVTLVGNSSGAGLGLAATQWLRDHGLPQPRALVLISPWLDVSVRRKEQATLAAVDPLQDVPGLVEAGRLYAGDLDVTHPFVSPLNGDLRGLAPITVFTGTLDLLHPDSIELAQKAELQGVPLALHVRKGLPHNYPLLPTPEGREARAMIARALAREPQ